MNKIEDWFYNHPHKMKCYKWIHYFEIYEKHFARYSKKENVRILEIGVYNGGSLEMWDYFFNQAEVVGLDINPECLDLQKNFGQNVTIELGDQANPNFWQDFKERNEPFDIIIDDGGHMMNQQETSFDCMYDHVKEDGVYLVEDTHTSYFHNFGGGLKRPTSFVEKSKDLVDSLHIHHFKDDSDKTPVAFEFHSKTKSIAFYDSVIVFEKGKQIKPEAKNI